MPGPISQSYEGMGEWEGPEDDDWMTGDYVHWITSAGDDLKVEEGEDWKVVLKAKMDAEKFWPNVWYCNERGVWDLLDIDTGGFVTK